MTTRSLKFTCPDPITWTNNVAKLFTKLDVEHMLKVSQGSLDLCNYASVKMYAHTILGEGPIGRYAAAAAFR